MAEPVSVAIPVRNGGSLLREVLVAVRAQRLDHPVELLVADSGSTDGSRDLARRMGAELIDVPPAEFSHGATRNLLAERSRGSHVAFLTQDAVPADERWLADLLEGFHAAEDVGLVFGPYRARPEASLMVRRELDDWFASLPLGAERGVGKPLDVRRSFFTDANGCIARAAWERVPFRPVSYAEDQLLARDMLAAGYAKVYRARRRRDPLASVRPLEQFRRAFDEWRGLREVGALTAPPAPRAAALECSAPCATSPRPGPSGGSARRGRRGHRRGVAAPPLPACGRRRARLTRRAPAAGAASGVLTGGTRRFSPTRAGVLMAGGSKLPRRGRRRPLLNDLPRRAYLTVKHQGWSELLVRVATSPLRLVGLERGLRARMSALARRRRVRGWYRREGRLVTIVMPTYGNPSTTIDAVARLRRTLRPGAAQIVVVDDGSEPRDQERLEELTGPDLQLELASENRGYAASVNRGLEHAGHGHDVVVLNNDVIAQRGWLEALQHAAYRDHAGVVGPMLLYPDGRIQAAGAHRNLGAPEWFDHRYRFKRPGHGPAGVPDTALAVTGACMYLRRALVDELGPFDEGFPMAYEDVDYCLRAWEAGWEVRYEPSSRLTHVESPTRGTEVGERERRSQAHFWAKWGDWFDARSVLARDGGLRIIYVTEGTEVGGGHRDVFEHLNRLRRRGHSVELYSLGGPPAWFPLEAPVRTFGSYEGLAAALAREDALKVATWWATAPAVWRASVTRGLPVYFVQDIETSYYAGDELKQDRVLASYREEFRYMTISNWNRERLAELGLTAELVPPGIDLDNFRPLDISKRDDVVLAVGRSLPLKNLGLSVEAWQRLQPRPELWMFGIEPELGLEHGARYFERPSDERVNELLNEATVFVQTSIHEGFCLPLLEAMAAGTPVVATDAHGNRDFCRHEENCLIAEPDPAAVSAAIGRLLGDSRLRDRLAAAGLATAAEYAWERRIDQLERFHLDVAEHRAVPKAIRPGPAS